MRRIYKYAFAAIVTIGIISASIFAPAAIAKYNDRYIINAVTIGDLAISDTGYKYQLSDLERVLIFSKARENLSAIQRYTATSLKNEQRRLESMNAAYNSDESGYAIFSNQRGSGNDEFSQEEIIDVCKMQLTKLKSIPFFDDIIFDEYEAELFSIVNMSDPSVNLSIWEINDIQPDGASLWQFEIDAQTGKIYNFNVVAKNEIMWTDIDTDNIISDFCDYLSVENATPYTKTDMAEKTPYYKKYAIKANGSDEIPITIGLNPVNMELFLRMP